MRSNQIIEQTNYSKSRFYAWLKGIYERKKRDPKLVPMQVAESAVEVIGKYPHFSASKGMEKTKAFISVGHYPRRPGSVNTKYGLIEHHEARKIVDAFFTEIITPQTICSYIPVSSLPLSEKVKFINAEANDTSVAIEIHFNAWEPNKAQGIETLYFPGSEKGSILASCIQEALLDLLPFADRGLKERDNLHLLKATTIPTIIVEVLFIDNDQEASYLFYPRSHLLIAKALFQGIEGYIEGNVSGKRAEV